MESLAELDELVVTRDKEGRLAPRPPVQETVSVVSATV